eukprot:CAMPEP_0172774288 /NCGR_PEP_ID=MMETSP1074-20121228/195861_1 /TAXON_ID=2916 /ORGANISM="Ceratium fusus, Strain PA161109" /LENGTH=165 /DNA_ID=CAMNT_0013610697 /DNA_START=498 /DNA_END=996 /DNA_ORIENTATION=-
MASGSGASGTCLERISNRHQGPAHTQAAQPFGGIGHLKKLDGLLSQVVESTVSAPGGLQGRLVNPEGTVKVAQNSYPSRQWPVRRNNPIEVHHGRPRSTGGSAKDDEALGRQTFRHQELEDSFENAVPTKVEFHRVLTGTNVANERIAATIRDGDQVSIFHRACP